MRKVIVISGVGGLSLACGGLSPPCGPLAIEGNPCAIKRQCVIVGQADDCGLNGYECRDNTWRPMMTYCNPPPTPAVETCDHITPGEPCTTGASCSLSEPEACGLLGYSCVGEVWEADVEDCTLPALD